MVSINYMILSALFIGALFGNSLALPDIGVLSFYNLVVVCGSIYAIKMLLHNQFAIRRQMVAPFVLFGLYFVWAGITVINADDIAASLKIYYYLFGGLVLLFYSSTAESDKFATALYKIMYSYIFVLAGVVFFEVFTGRHLSAVAETAGKLYDKSFALPFGFFGNPNDLSVAVMLIFPFMFCYAMNDKKYISSAIIFALSFILIFLSASRGVLGVTMLFPLIYLITTGISRKTIAPIIIAICFCLVAFVSYYYATSATISSKSESIIDRTMFRISSLLDQDAGFGSGHDPSVNTRISIINYTLDSLDDLYFGKGPGQAELFIRRSSIYPEFDNPHNLWIEILICYGFFGLILFVSGYVLLMIKTFRITRNTTNKSIKTMAQTAFITLTVFTILAAIPSSVLHGFQLAYFPLSYAFIALNSREGAA